MTQITTTTTTFLPNLHLFGRNSNGGYQAYHLAQPGFPVWGVVVIVVAVTALALVGIVILRRSKRT